MTPRKARWLGLLATGLIRTLGVTWRVRIEGLDGPMRREIYAILHGHLLLPVFRVRRQRAVVMISRHHDGEIIARAVERLGFATVRGSSTRGGAAAAAALLRAGGDAAGGSFAERPWVVTPDGPKGPRGSVKEGLIRLAAAAGRPIRPAAGAARPAKVFASWDRFTLPLPFAKVVVSVGEPLHVPPDATADQVRALARELEQRLLAAEKAAGRALASW